MTAAATPLDSPWALVAVLGLGAITILTRGLFYLGGREWPLPAWLHQAFRHAPLAALVAVVVPEVVMHNGQLLCTWADARPYAAAAGVAYYLWRRGILGTIAVGMVVVIGLKLGLGLSG